MSWIVLQIRQNRDGSPGRVFLCFDRKGRWELIKALRSRRNFRREGDHIHCFPAEWGLDGDLSISVRPYFEDYEVLDDLEIYFIDDGALAEHHRATANKAPAARPTGAVQTLRRWLGL